MEQTLTLRVEGMRCEACERRLRTVLGRLDGVAAVAADHTTGTVRLRVDLSRVDADTLTPTATERIERAGFTVLGQDEQAMS